MPAVAFLRFVSEKLFPSGPWVGFYNYRPTDRHRMDLRLEFTQGKMTGEGNDDVGAFLISGKYDTQTLECYWTKTYVGAHNVFYRGFREGKGIWGTWQIKTWAHGGFHIWPRQAGEGEGEVESTAEPQAADAIATEEIPAQRVTRS